MKIVCFGLIFFIEKISLNFINNVKKKKNVDLDLTFDIKELMKDIYRNVR